MGVGEAPGCDLTLAIPDQDTSENEPTAQSKSYRGSHLSLLLLDEGVDDITHTTWYRMAKPKLRG